MRCHLILLSRGPFQRELRTRHLVWKGARKFPTDLSNISRAPGRGLTRLATGSRAVFPLPCEHDAGRGVGGGWPGGTPLDGVYLFAVSLKVVDTCILLHTPDLENAQMGQSVSKRCFAGRERCDISHSGSVREVSGSPPGGVYGWPMGRGQNARGAGADGHGEGKGSQPGPRLINRS